MSVQSRAFLCVNIDIQWYLYILKTDVEEILYSQRQSHAYNIKELT